jgi:MurNAc alpha-1-phosphate uridylyltransferase
MRPLTLTRPKPLIEVRSRTLIDRVLDRLAEAGVTRAVVNIHYLGDQIAAHLASREVPRIAISDERDRLLDTGGGVLKALPLIGPGPFMVHNSDTIWHERGTSNLRRLAKAWDCERMDLLMLLAEREASIGYSGNGDFVLGEGGRIHRRPAGSVVPHIFAGVSIMSPRLLVGAPEGPFSLNIAWDTAITAGRAYGLELEATWMHVGDPAALTEAERYLGAVDGGA